jgi:hypothetical protein
LSPANQVFFSAQLVLTIEKVGMKPSSTSSCFALGTDVKTAFYQTVHRPEGDDFKWKLSEPVKVEGKTASVSHEFIELTLKLANGDVIKEHLFQVLPRPELSARQPSRTGLDLNVLIFAMDSISNGHAQRKLPKSYGYIRDELQGYVFSGHSAVGDGTTEQLAALLSGRGEREQPEARRGMPGAQVVDNWDWIFKKAKGKNGFITRTPEHLYTPSQKLIPLSLLN